MSGKKLLNITSDLDTEQMIQRVAAQNLYAVLTVHKLEEIQHAYLRFKPHLILLDMHLESLDGVSLLNYLTNIHCDTQIIMVGVEDEKLLLAIKHIGQAKGLKLHSILKRPLTADSFEKQLKSIDQLAMASLPSTQGLCLPQLANPKLLISMAIKVCYYIAVTTS